MTYFFFHSPLCLFLSSALFFSFLFRISFFRFSYFFSFSLSLFPRSEQLNKRGFPSVGRSVTSYLFGLSGATNAVYTALFPSSAFPSHSRFHSSSYSSFYFYSFSFDFSLLPTPTPTPSPPSSYSRSSSYSYLLAPLFTKKVAVNKT